MLRMVISGIDSHLLKKFTLYLLRQIGIKLYNKII